MKATPRAGVGGNADIEVLALNRARKTQDQCVAKPSLASTDLSADVQIA
jgi:hypothetical protein